MLEPSEREVLVTTRPTQPKRAWAPTNELRHFWDRVQYRVACVMDSGAVHVLGGLFLLLMLVAGGRWLVWELEGAPVEPMVNTTR